MQAGLSYRAVLSLLLIGFALVWFANLDYRRLIKTDEGRYAEIAREMAVSGDWVTPRLNGYKYFEKPPLQYWATAAAFKLFGENEWTARLWTALTGFAGVIVAFVTGRKLWDSATGTAAAMILAGSIGWVALGHVSSLDMGLAFFLSLAVSAFAIAQRDAAGGCERLAWMLIAWAAAGLAVLSKGLVGIVLPTGALAVYLLWERDWRLLKRLHALPGLILFLAITMPWFVLVSLRNPEFLQFFFIHEHLDRFLTREHGRYGPWWYFVPILLACWLPWTLALPGIGATGARRIDARFQPQRFLLVWSAVVFLFFSVSSSKLPAYILPIFPALALLSGHVLMRAGARTLAWQWGILAFLALALAAMAPWRISQRSGNVPPELLAAYTPWIVAGALLLALGALVGIALAKRGARLAAIGALAVGSLACAQLIVSGHESLSSIYSAYHIAEKIKPELRPGIPVFAVDTFDHTLPFYLGQTLVMVSYKDELAVPIGWEPRTFLPDVAAFERAWRAAPAAFALMGPREYERLEKEGLPMQLVVRDPRRVVVKKPEPPR